MSRSRTFSGAARSRSGVTETVGLEGWDRSSGIANHGARVDLIEVGQEQY